MSTASAACSDSNSTTDARDKRLPLGPTSKLALLAWNEIIPLKVQADRSHETVAAHVEASANSGFWCRKCFTLFERYEKTTPGQHPTSST